MKKIPFLWLISVTIFLSASAQNNDSARITLPNGWSLSPAGHGYLLGDLPLNMAVSNSKKLLAVTNNGYGKQTIQLINTSSEKIVDNVTIGKSWVGLKFSDKEKYLYASGGNDNWIIKYEIINNKLLPKDTLVLGKKWPEKISPAGLDIDDKRNLLYVVTKENNSLYILNLKTKKVIGKYQLGGEGYTCLLSPDKKELYISCWGCDKLMVFNTLSRTISRQINVGDNPNDICLTKNGKYLFVANSNDNSVSVIDTHSKKVIETLTSSLYPNAPQGSTTNGLALSPDEKTLYIANADNNCLTLFDVSNPGKSISMGFIPTGWYPTCVKVIGDKIFVTNGKGVSSFPNPNGPGPTYVKEKVTYQKGITDTVAPKHNQYIAGLFIGTMSIINVPDKKQLGIYSKKVYANTPYTKAKETEAQGQEGNPIPRSLKDTSPIKYVFYIVKENRTYDQVLGDVKEGNGDTSLVLFGKNITPNQHKIVSDFVLLDNFYVDAEVSADGHNWSLGAYATDYLEKTWPTSYGGRGGIYDAEGNRAIANNKNGFLWNDCERAGISYRTYGEFADNYKPNIPVLKNHLCNYYTGWNLDVRDTVRFSQWKRDFDSLVSINALPRLNTLRFPNDHTSGMRKGQPTPFAYAADNDLAVGMFLDHLSKSPVWKESVVFIVEDDAQNGPDHVDAHRSPVYLAGPHVKRNFVDHTSYTTSGILRTIELILDIPPMSQYDAAATPLWRCFTSNADFEAFDHLPEIVDLNDKNIVVDKLSKQSDAFNFSKEDEVPDGAFNEVLWKGIKGINSPLPSPKRAAFIIPIKKDDDDD
ncbi:MAG: bifunctional YncE family protein/alkaline phosphatase family protein [Ginsengibacter sp.]